MIHISVNPENNPRFDSLIELCPGLVAAGVSKRSEVDEDITTLIAELLERSAHPAEAVAALLAFTSVITKDLAGRVPDLNLDDYLQTMAAQLAL